MKGLHMDKNLKIYVSFKNNSEEYVVYKFIKNKGDMSNYIKDLVKADIKKY